MKGGEKMKLNMFLAGTLLLALFLLPGIGIAQVSVHVSLPPLVISAPPVVAVIPGTYVYFAPDVQAEIFFYGGYWYRPYEGGWYRATSYNGPWGYVNQVPGPLYHLPPNYRSMSGYSYRHIPYNDVHANWRGWERGKYWEKRGWEKHDMQREREHGAAPPYSGHEERHR